MTAPTIVPKTAAELEAMLQDSTTLASIAKTPATLGEFIRNYVQAQQAKQGEYLAEQVREQSQIVLAEMLRDNGAILRGRPDLSGLSRPSQNKGQVHNKLAIGAALDGEFSGVADFLHSCLPGNKLSPTSRDRWQRIRNDYSTIDPATGGFLVPEILRSTLLANALETAVVRPRATVIAMDAPSVPFPTIDDTSHTSTVFGGISASWVAEGAAMPETEAKFGRIVLRANKLVTYCEVPSELPMDAPAAFGSFLDQRLPQAISYFEDDAFLSGNGVAKPLGVLNAGNLALVSQAKETNQVAATIVWENVVKMFARMLPASISSAVWVCSIDTFPQLATMALAVGTGGTAVWLNNGVSGPPATILGRPVFFSEKTSALGTLGDINFIDFGQYLVGDMMSMRVQSSEHYKFNQDLIAYRVIERADGRPWMVSALTPRNGSSNTLSPYVTLATRS